MNIMTVSSADSAIFSVKSSSSNSGKQNGELALCVNIVRILGIQKTVVGGYMVDHQMVRNVRQMTSESIITSQPPTPAGDQGDHGTSSLEPIAQSGTSQSLSLISIDRKKPWILDSGVTYHLTGSS